VCRWLAKLRTLSPEPRGVAIVRTANHLEGLEYILSIPYARLLAHPSPAAFLPKGEVSVLTALLKLSVPPELDGSTGSNRGELNPLLLSASTDLQAANAFLAEYTSSKGTQRIYRREIERLMMWAIQVRGKPLSSLSREDFDAYLDFLNDPQPRGQWCGPKRPRASTNWRPFVGPVKGAALSTCLAALSSFFKWLTDAGYLRGNPLGLVRKKQRKPQPQVDKVTRFLEPALWDTVLRALSALPRACEEDDAHYQRMRFWLNFLYHLAPRAGELESHTMSSFAETRGRWWWHVVGKGQKAAKVPLTDAMIESLIEWRQYLGLSPIPARQEATPLLLSVDSILSLRRQVGLDWRAKAEFASNLPALGARQFNRLLKDLFSQAATSLPPALRYLADKLRQASAHWGRHTSITAMVDAGMDPRYVRLNARHSDPRTTLLYVHEEDERWHEETQKLQSRLPTPK